MAQFSRAIALVCLAGLLTACSTARFETVAQTALESAPAGRQLTLPLRLVADTQFHESRGTASRNWSLAGDEFVAVTIRTGQQVIGTGDILYEAIGQTKDFPLTLHIGDAIDVSCATEWERFSEVMGERLGKPGPDSWIFTPGNHDGYLVGNFFPAKKGLYTQAYWSQVCNVGRTYQKGGNKVVHDFIPKRELLTQYLTSLNLDGGTPPGSSGSICIDGKRLCVAYHLSSDEWTSYIVQLVRVPAPADAPFPIYALMLDTSDYASRPYLGLTDVHAGIDGALSLGQLQYASALAGNLPAGARFFVLAHHPLHAWQIDSWPTERRSALGQLLESPKFLDLLVSAHTHEGGWADHVIGKTKVTEMNIGSLIDAPVQYRSLSFEADDRGVVSAVSKRILMSSFSGVDCSQFPLPPDGSGYSVNDQKSEADRAGNAPLFIGRFLSAANAFKHYFAFWRAKHQELKAHLLTYADVVERSMPPEQGFSFKTIGFENPVAFATRAALVERLRFLSNCDDGVKCSVTEKGNILYALERYYAEKSSDEVRDRAHVARYCYAVRSAEAAAQGSGGVQSVLDRTSDTRRRLNSTIPPN